MPLLKIGPLSSLRDSFLPLHLLQLKLPPLEQPTRAAPFVGLYHSLMILPETRLSRTGTLDLGNVDNDAA